MENKRSFLIFFLLAIFFFFLSPGPIVAQQEELERCQKYYEFGEVKVNLNTKKTSHSPGEKLELFGTVVNNNSFPLLNITVFAHLKRINKDTYLENGHFLIDKLILAQDLNFLPKETKELSVSLPIKNNYPQGAYQLQYFVFSKEGFNYSGRPFLEEDFAGITNFEIKNTRSAEVFFDLNTLTLDGAPQKIRDYIPVFEKGNNPNINITLADSRTSKDDIFVNYRWYAWDDSFEKNLVKTGKIHLLANQPSLVQTVFDLTEPRAYILLLEINEPVRSLFKFRIARKGEKTSKLRMNDFGITNYPIHPENDRAFVCFHSPGEKNSPQTRVTLSLLNKEGQILEKKSVEDSFGGEVMAISLPLTKVADPLNFSIEANFENLENPSLSQKVRSDYDCHLFDKSLASLDAKFEQNKIKLAMTNLCGEPLADSYAESLIIYQNGQIKDERYNLKPIPSEIDTADLAPGSYQLLVKSGQLEKKLDFRIDNKIGKQTRNKKSRLTSLLSAVLIAQIIALIAFLIYYFKKKRQILKPKEGNET